MTFANPADARADDRTGAPYIASLLTVLGDRDPFAVMEEQADALAAIGAGVPDPLLRRPEAPGKWSMIEVMQHLADTELVYGYRVRTTLATPGAPIIGYDQDVWARTLRYRDATFAEAMEQMRILRRINLRLLKSLSEEELDRFGMHSERGRESVRQVIRLTGGHDLVHRRQLERIKKTVSA
jgi:hypothetical protein